MFEKKNPHEGEVVRAAVQKDNNNAIDITTEYAICQVSYQMAKRIREFNSTFEASRWLGDILVKLGLALWEEEFPDEEDM